MVACAEGTFACEKLLSSRFLMAPWLQLASADTTQQHNTTERRVQTVACQDSDCRQIIRCQVNESTGS